MPRVDQGARMVPATASLIGIKDIGTPDMFAIFRTNIERSGWRGLAIAALAIVALSLAAWTLMVRADEEPAAKSYQLNHVRAAEFAAELRPLLDGLDTPTELRIDEQTNRILLRGDEEAQQLAADVIGRLDQPAGAHANSLQAYAVPREKLQATLQELNEKYPAATGVRVSADERSSQLLVLAPQKVHDELSTLLPKLTSTAPRRVPAVRLQATLPLDHIDPRAFEAALARLWHGQLPVRVSPQQEVATVSFPDPDGQPVELKIDRRNRQVSIDATETAVNAWSRVVQALDRPAKQADEEAALVSVGKAERSKVELALAAFQPDAEGLPPAVVEGAPVDPPAAGEEGGQLGPVRIEFLEGLDVIVVRGNKRDVARVVKIINDIERLSAQTQPKIEVLALQHIDSTAVAELILPLYEQVLQPRQGVVSITALVKPNALLLVGRPESVASVVELVRKLDEPVPPATQFRVFKLRYLSAENAAQTITDFYAEPGGLATRVQVLPDFRSNAVVVRASPRDLIEVDKLLEEIDAGESDAVNEVKLFPLKNSLAEELAPVLQEAIRGGGVEVQGGVGPQGQQPQRSSRDNQDARSAMLTLSTIDAEGKRILKSGILTDVRITADARANALIVTGPPENMPLIAALINQLDSLPAAEAQIKVFTILNGDATALAEMLQDLFGQDQGNQGLPTIGAGGESLVVPLRFSIDQRTNSIIASGASPDLAVVEAILLRLDESDIDQRKSEVFRLQNAPAIDVANAINEYLRSEREVQQIAATGVSPFEQIEREVIVVPEPVNNSLIVSATPRYFDEIMELVEDLDKQPPMVLIQVLIAEVRLNDIDELGVELGI